MPHQSTTQIPITSTTSAMEEIRSCKVAVIGAGASGLVAARELRREGHTVTVFERGHTVGGLWVYDPRVESDPLGLDPARTVVHGGLYSSLRTNLPRELMSFSDFSFRDKCFGDPRNFPSHEEVLAYLKAFAEEFGVLGLVRFGVEVVRVGPGERKDEWFVEWRGSHGSPANAVLVDRFEAVMICNGHYTEPSVAEIPGIERWPGTQIHSHSYRIPDPFQDKVVVVIGKGPSAIEISKDISTVAKEVHLAMRPITVHDPGVFKLDGKSNILTHSMIDRAFDNGKIVFKDGFSVYADIILHCTGYKYHFPFLKTSGIITIDDNRIEHLYKHVFPPEFAPWLSFTGTCGKTVITFLAKELEAKWVAQALSGKRTLPSQEEMMARIDALYLDMEKTGKPKHLTHSILPNQIEYITGLADETDVPIPVERIKELFSALVEGSSTDADGYKDSWDEKHRFKEHETVSEIN